MYSEYIMKVLKKKREENYIQTQRKEKSGTPKVRWSWSRKTNQCSYFMWILCENQFWEICEVARGRLRRLLSSWT